VGRHAPFTTSPLRRGEEAGGRGPICRLGAILCLALVALALALVALSASPAAAQGVDEQAHAIAKELRCPICQGLSVADSPTELARQMRAIIRDKLAQGESREAVIQYFVERYGEEVLMAPPARGLGLLAWLVPGIALLAGLAIVGLALRSWLRREPAALDEDDELLEVDGAEDDPEARQALERWQRGVL
jgi:cytochrome c-type biogenesis protein CcmH